MKNTLLISFSGGRTSAFMCDYIIKAEKYKDYEKVFVFANTGKEREETLEFVNECDKFFNLNLIWLEAKFTKEHGKKNWFKIVDYESAARNGEPFEAFIKKERISNAAYPNCSGRLKSIPIHKFMGDNGYKNYYTAIGIRADETQRINWESANENKYIYPLATDFRVDSKYIRKWWSNQSFDLQLKDYEGNCDMCWKKSKRKLMTLILEKPNLINWWNDMEIKYGENEFTFWRNNEMTEDLIGQANNTKFKKAIDLFELDNMQSSMFDNDLDVGANCFCK